MAQQDEPSPFDKVLAQAFDRAWETFLAAEGQEADTAENRGSLAARIVVLAKLGESAEEAIASAAVLYLRAFLAAKALGGKSSSTTPSAGVGDAGPVLNQEAIAAAAAAYEACLEELPDGISAGARSLLLHSILENAGKGHQDLAQLREFALEALRSRK